MRIIILAALFACTLSAEVKPKWVLPRLPLDFILSGKAFLVDENSRIVGGNNVDPNSLPFQISLQRNGANGWSHSCGGSILSETKILNAAHCLSGAVSNLRVVAGEHDLSTSDGREQIVGVAAYTNHPNYNSRTSDNDVSVITLSSRLTLNTYVRTIALARQGTDPAADTACTVSGWGTTSSGGSISNTLKSVNVKIVDRDQCNGDDAYVGKITSNMICAGEVGKDSCQGDSGGPLFTGTGTTATQIGIVSWGYGCADPKYPGVYTRVGMYNTWINGQL